MPRCPSLEQDSSLQINPLRSVWMPLLSTNPILLKTTISFAAVHLDMLHGRQDTSSTLAKKVEVINTIRAQLQRPSQAATNSTIAAIAMLACMEVSRIPIRQPNDGYTKATTVEDDSQLRRLRTPSDSIETSRDAARGA